jgi:hypothetical protein
MTLIFQSDALEAIYHPEGYLELIVHEAHDLEMQDFGGLRDALLAAGHEQVKVLINRIHPYSTGVSVLLPPHPRFKVQVLKAAYLVYSDRAAIVSGLVGNLTLPQTPHEIFYGDRERAIAWLLADPESGNPSENS